MRQACSFVLRRQSRRLLQWASPCTQTASQTGPPNLRHYNTGEASGAAFTPPLIYPQAPATQHTDLPTFLAYAERTGLDVKSTVYVGTHYEYRVASALAQYGFFLKRIGGSSDFGTDLLGTWTPPTTSQTMRVLLQCKAGSQRVGPHLVRELEGAFAGAPIGWKGSGVLGFLVSEKPATKGVRDSLARSRWPMGYACCSREGVLQQMLWNRGAEEQGLEGFGVVARHTGGGEGKAGERLVLVRNGKTLPLLESGVY
ncbi:hypothetical protein S7711_00398 [Stachybotrys chartarum IBT 7711]|uniref:Restriction endonuclease type IV Mrr domain-containing protein n=1 Tax=Stachybotrys chartarum (strain CBS 109288 / IBT 7711) TaxID=1280523 RepID=A0A084B9L1_STACB|nr:hypothetical protein S7711_00398 [Stachybotrys chartarum IBT 7711]